VNLLADEGVDRPIVERLRQDGHDVLYIAEMDPGISDEVVLAEANEQGALLVTADKDFGELVFRQRRVSNGVVLLRLAGISLERRSEIVSAVLREHAAVLVQAFSVISPGTVRIRHKQGNVSGDDKIPPVTPDASPI
jgi:predicted nuclease of predicted toxin-antitoxin system